LTAAYHCLKKGCEVEVFELEQEPGGLASSFDFSGTFIERYYHFVCFNDDPLFALLKELDIYEKLKWYPAKMGFFYEGKEYPFTSPMDLMRFKPIGILDRIRFGLNVLYSKNIQYWQQLESISAKKWLTRHIGARAYEVIWDPLIRVKFGSYADQISAAWIWHRIHRVAKSRKSSLSPGLLGYISGGSEALVSTLIDKIKEMGGKIHLNCPVKSLIGDSGKITGLQLQDRSAEFDGVISTVPAKRLSNLVKPLNEKYGEELSEIKIIGVVCMILKLKKPVTNNFWLNINDSRISFNGIIELTNLNLELRESGTHIAYIPFYLPVDEARYNFPDQQLFDEYLKAIKLINPEFKDDWVLDHRVFRNSMAQTICTTNFSKKIPSIKSPIKGLAVTDSSQLYPEDRTISGTIKVASDAADVISSQL